MTTIRLTVGWVEVGIKKGRWKGLLIIASITRKLIMLYIIIYSNELYIYCGLLKDFHESRVLLFILSFE